MHEYKINLPGMNLFLFFTNTRNAEGSLNDHQISIIIINIIMMRISYHLINFLIGKIAFDAHLNCCPF
jgi:hypothetical protein